MVTELKDSKLIKSLRLVDIDKISSEEKYSFKESSWERAIESNENQIREKAFSNASELGVGYFRLKNVESRVDYSKNFLRIRRRGTERIISVAEVHFYADK